MRIRVDPVRGAGPADRLAALSTAVDVLLESWHGAEAARFEELWAAWSRAARAVCSALGQRPPALVPAPRAPSVLASASTSPTPSSVLAQMLAWQRDTTGVARDLESGAAAPPGDWRGPQAEMVTALAQLRGLVAAHAG